MQAQPLEAFIKARGGTKASGVHDLPQSGDYNLVVIAHGDPSTFSLYTAAVGDCSSSTCEAKFSCGGKCLVPVQGPEECPWDRELASCSDESVVVGDLCACNCGSGCTDE